MKYEIEKVAEGPALGPDKVWVAIAIYGRDADGLIVGVGRTAEAATRAMYEQLLDCPLYSEFDEDNEDFRRDVAEDFELIDPYETELH